MTGVNLSPGDFLASFRGEHILGARGGQCELALQSRRHQRAYGRLRRTPGTAKAGGDLAQSLVRRRRRRPLLALDVHSLIRARSQGNCLPTVNEMQVPIDTWGAIPSLLLAGGLSTDT